MKRYSALIRKLVNATAEAEATETDIVDILKERCFNETSLIRQTLMNAVCDPRFKIDADVVGYWRDEARHALEQLASLLENTNPLTEDAAYYILEDFLNGWFAKTFKEIKRPKSLLEDYATFSKRSEQKLLDSLEEIENLFNPQNPEGNIKSGDKEDDDSPDDAAVSGNDDNSQEESDREDKNHGAMVGSSHSTNILKLEERFLQLLMPSLVDLACRIGRMGRSGIRQASQFSSAGKSDIVGFTVGNDIGAVLPLELAMLADKRTQAVFYHKYTTRQLQLFASSSHSQNSIKHQDGPVIVCIDTSSSMDGEPMLVAKALAIAVAVIAWRRKRNVMMVKYSDSYDYIDLGNKRSAWDEMIKFLSHVPTGGNNENKMFSWLFNDIKPNLEEYDSADILCVSDFGWAPLSPETEQIIEEQKEKGLRFYGLNVHVDNADIGNMPSWMIGKPNLDNNSMNVCDSMWVYENGECKEVNRNNQSKKKN